MPVEVGYGGIEALLSTFANTIICAVESRCAVNTGYPVCRSERTCKLFYIAGFDVEIFL